MFLNACSKTLILIFVCLILGQDFIQKTKKPAQEVPLTFVCFCVFSFVP